MRLVLVKRVSFRKSEATNFAETRGHATLNKGEVICFYSARGDQVVFVYRKITVEGADGKRAFEVLASQRLRLISGETWNPLMLGNYAQRAGLKIDNLKLFQEHFVRMQEERRKERRAHAA